MTLDTPKPEIGAVIKYPKTREILDVLCYLAAIKECGMADISYKAAWNTFSGLILCGTLLCISHMNFHNILGNPFCCLETLLYWQIVREKQIFLSTLNAKF